LSQGFALEQVMSEYTALRANVLRHCFDDAIGAEEVVRDVIDLDRSIDRCLIESVAWFSRGLSSARDLFLGVLGHDLRSPLGAISTLATVPVQDPHAEPRTTMVPTRMASSAARMSKMIQHLLDFARTRLGGLLPLTTTRMALAPLVTEAVEEMRAALPDAVVRSTIEGLLEGDGARTASTSSWRT
jgi:signal transduction histidine kinase